VLDVLLRRLTTMSPLLFHRDEHAIGPMDDFPSVTPGVEGDNSTT